MFSSQVIVVLVPQSSVAALQACAVPVLRRHQHDDVLPGLPEEVEQLPNYTLHRPAPAWAQQDWIADAADAFGGARSLHGLVITASRTQGVSGDAGVLTIHSRSRPLWHADCQGIKPRGCSAAAATQQEAAARARRRFQQQQQQQQQGSSTAWWPTALVPVALLDEQPFLQDLADAIRAHNIRALEQQHQQTLGYMQPLIVPILLRTVQQTAAAVAVQSGWRAHSSRMVHCIAQRILRNRAACAVQRAWRAFVLRRRLSMLSAVAEAHRHAQTQLRFSNIMCVDVAGVRLLQAAADACRKGYALFPEHRLRFAVEPEGGDLFLVEPASGSSSSGSSGSSGSEGSSGNNSSSSSGGGGGPCTREGLPAWTGADIPVIPAECAAAAGAMDRADVAKLLELNCSVKDLLDPAYLPKARCSPQEVAQLVTFSTKQQAAQRAALLAAYTFDVRTGCYTQLMTVQESPLGAAYRKLTGLSTTSTTAGAPTAPATSSTSSSKAAPAVTTGGAASVGGPGAGAHCPTEKSRAPAPHKNTQRHNKLQVARLKNPAHGTGSAAAATSSAPACQVISATAAATTTSCQQDACASSRSAGALTARSQGYAMPLQPIRPTDTLLAAVQLNTAHPACSSGSGAEQAGSHSAIVPSSGWLQFYTSVLSRLPYLVKELAAEEVLQATATADAPSSSACSTPATGSSVAAAAEGVGWRSDTVQQQDDIGCLSCLPPSTIQAKADVKSLGAYLVNMQQQQVDAFKSQLASEAAAAVAAAAAAELALQQAVAAAKRDGEAVADTGPIMLSTNNVTSPDYYPLSTAEAAAATQALKQQIEAEAAARVAELREQQLMQLHEALEQEQARKAAAKAAAQADKQACHWGLQQEQQQRHAAAQQRAGTLKHVREAAPASRKARQQQAAAFAMACNQLSKHMRDHVVQRARAQQQLAAALSAQEQRGAAEAAAAALQQHLQDGLCNRQEKAQQQAQAAKAELLAAAAVQELELAAKRAAAAARLYHERSRAVAGGSHQ